MSGLENAHMSILAGASQLARVRPERYLRNWCGMEDAKQFLSVWQGPNVDDAIATACGKKRTSGVERRGDRRMVVERNVLQVAGNFNLDLGLRIGRDIADPFVVSQIEKLNSAVFAHRHECGAVRRESQIANTLGGV